jgi:hypothetical protein
MGGVGGCREIATSVSEENDAVLHHSRPVPQRVLKQTKNGKYIEQSHVEPEKAPIQE